MATTRKQGATDQTQDAADNQQENHAQTPDQPAANSGAYAQSSYQNTQRAGAQASSQAPDAAGQAGEGGNLLDTAVQTGKKWLDDSGVLQNANQLPQAAKEWGNKALNSVNSLSTTQKVVGGALLLAGVAFLSTRGKSKDSSSSDDDNYRAGGKSGGYRQGSWAGYAGGKSAARRNTELGSRSEASSYGTERRSSSSYGRGAGSTDTDFGSGRSSGATYGGNRNAADSGSSQGNYRSGSSYNSGSSAPSSSSPSSSSVGRGQGSFGSSPNSNEQDYDASL